MASNCSCLFLSECEKERTTLNPCASLTMFQAQYISSVICKTNRLQPVRKFINISINATKLNPSAEHSSSSEFLPHKPDDLSRSLNFLSTFFTCLFLVLPLFLLTSFCLMFLNLSDLVLQFLSTSFTTNHYVVDTTWSEIPQPHLEASYWPLADPGSF